jgi:hypothetical protein
VVERDRCGDEAAARHQRISDEYSSLAEVPDEARHKTPSPSETASSIAMYGSRGIRNRGIERALLPLPDGSFALDRAGPVSTTCRTLLYIAWSLWLLMTVIALNRLIFQTHGAVDSGHRTARNNCIGAATPLRVTGPMSWKRTPSDRPSGERTRGGR